MATVSGNYRVTNIPTIAAIITLIDAQLTAENARCVALGGAATSITGSITLSITAENGASETYTHRITISVNCPTLADATTLTAALSVMATAMETESDYTTVTITSVSMSTSMSN